MPLIMINIALAQSPTVTVKGSHTLTQGDGVGIYEAVDLCLKQAIINGVFDYLNSTCLANWSRGVFTNDSGVARHLGNF